MKQLRSKSSCVLVLIALGLATARAATFNVSVVAGPRFSPAVTNISVGDTIIWSGLASFHTVTPNTGVTEPFCGSLVQPSCTVTFNNPGSFSYHCNPHQGLGMTGLVVVAAPNLSPTAVITNLPADSVVTTPGTVTILAAVNDPDGSLVQVRLITNGIGMLTNTTPPFGTFVLSNLPAIRFSVRVQARDNQGASANSPTIIIRPASPPALILGQGTNSPLQLQFNSATGINYVVEQTSGLTNFTPVVTNPGSGGLLQFSDTNSSSAQKFIRVRLQ